MPEGKPAGIRCVNLTEGNACAIHGKENYPAVCGGLSPSEEMCGVSNEEAFAYLAELEIMTKPGKQPGHYFPYLDRDLKTS